MALVAVLCGNVMGSEPHPVIVTCASCGTKFALDDQQVGPEGATVRCSVCRHVFRVGTANGSAPAHPWQIRTIDDLLFTAPDLATLRAWILEGRLHPDDAVSRTGRHFVRLGDMPEFVEAFEGFANLPPVLRVDVQRGPSEQSARDVLGPPPAFGTHAAEGGSGPITTPNSDSSSLSLSLSSAADSQARIELGIVGHPIVDDPSSIITPADFERHNLPVSRPGPAPGPTWPRDLPEPDELEQTVARPVPAQSDAPVIVAHAAAAEEVTHARPASGPVVAASGPPSRSRPPARPGVPQAVSDERSSRPASMLHVVTQHVRPIPTPAGEGQRARAESGPLASASALAAAAAAVPPPVPHSLRSTSPPELVVDPTPANMSDEGPARRRPWPLFAALGGVAGLALILGVPSVRAQLFGVATPPPPATTQTADDTASLEAEGAAALATAEPQALARAEAAVRVAAQRATDPALADRLRLLQAELLATRAIDHELWGAVDPAVRNDARYWAQEDAMRAVAVLGEVGPSADAAARARATALLALAQGRVDQVSAHAAGDAELQLVITVAPLFRDDAAVVDDDTRAQLAAHSNPSILARLALAVAEQRSGRAEAARAIAKAVLEQVPAQPVARALLREAAKPAATGAEPAIPTADPAATKGAVVGVENVARTAPDATAPAETPDRLIDRGCRKAESGDANGAVPLLRRALELKPRDADAALCLGDANSKLGNYEVALKNYQKALARNPQMLSALAGAARAAAKLGRSARAVAYYKQLLEVDPSHSQARAYLDAHPEHTAGEAGNG